jgi:hypothetical protein
MRAYRERASGLFAASAVRHLGEEWRDYTGASIFLSSVRGRPDGRVGRELPEESPGSKGRTAS